MTIGSRLATVAGATLVTGVLLACGGGSGGDGGTSYALLIHQPDSLTTTADSIFLSGEGFLPAGSRCPGTCEGLLPPPVFGDLGAYTLAWSNAATGQSNRMLLRWQCNCGGSAPYWMTDVPLAPGANLITIVETDATGSQQAAITITRK